jgi:hypothetical protein
VAFAPVSPPEQAAQAAMDVVAAKSSQWRLWNRGGRIVVLLF